MFDIVCLGNYYATLSDVGKGSGLENLKTLTRSLCREQFRRIDRFIQLSLIGSARCIANLPADEPLDPRTGLYIASGMAAISNNVRVQKQMFIEGQLPKPVNFINTLSNAAGFYVARNLELNNQNLFVSRGDASLEAILQLVDLDFQVGSVKQALVGVVDECVEPLEEHRQRLGLVEDALLGEGSHWFLLRPGRLQEGSLGNSGLALISEVQTLVNVQGLERWLKSVFDEQKKDDLRIHIVPGVPLSTSLMSDIDHVRRYEPVLGRYGARTAGIVARFIESDDGRELVTICADSDGRFHVLRAVKPA